MQNLEATRLLPTARDRIRPDEGHFKIGLGGAVFHLPPLQDTVPATPLTKT